MKIYLLIKNYWIVIPFTEHKTSLQKKLFELNINIKDIEINLLFFLDRHSDRPFKKSAKICTFLVCLRDKKILPK